MLERRDRQLAIASGTVEIDPPSPPRPRRPHARLKRTADIRRGSLSPEGNLGRSPRNRARLQNHWLRLRGDAAGDHPPSAPRRAAAIGYGARRSPTAVRVPGFFPGGELVGARGTLTTRIKGSPRGPQAACPPKPRRRGRQAAADLSSLPASLRDDGLHDELRQARNFKRGSSRQTVGYLRVQAGCCPAGHQAPPWTLHRRPPTSANDAAEQVNDPLPEPRDTRPSPACRRCLSNTNEERNQPGNDLEDPSVPCRSISNVMRPRSRLCPVRYS